MESTSTPSAPALTRSQIRTILIGLMTGLFLGALDQTIVSTAIRTIGDHLGGQALQAWVTTAYLITSTVTTPLYGKLSDIYGRRPLFLTAISIFVIGSIACTFSSSMYMLAAFRAIQGIGAGGLFTLALAILADIVAPRERAKYQGYFIAVFGTSSVLGPVVGGLFAGAPEFLGLAGWRWVFLVNVPIGLVALFVVAKVLHVPHHRHDHAIDWWGALALVVGVVPFLLVAEQGREWGWLSPVAISMYALSTLGHISFILIELRMKDEALIPMRLFRTPAFSMGLLANTIIGVVMFGSVLVLPLYLQIVRGLSPTEAGLATLPLTLGIMSGSLLSGQLTAKTGRYKVFPILGTTLLIVAALLLTTKLDLGTGNWAMWGMFYLLGLGLGLCMQTLLTAVQNVVPARDMGVATSSATFFRQMGGTLGAAIFLSVLFSTMVDNIRAQVQLALGDPAFLAAAAKGAQSSEQGAVIGFVQHLGASMQTDTSFLNRVDPILAKPFQDGFVQSTHLVLIITAFVAAAGLMSVIFLKEHPLRTKSGIDEISAMLNAETAGLTGQEYVDGAASVEPASDEGQVQVASADVSRRP